MPNFHEKNSLFGVFGRHSRNAALIERKDLPYPNHREKYSGHGLSRWFQCQQVRVSSIGDHPIRHAISGDYFVGLSHFGAYWALIILNGYSELVIRHPTLLSASTNAMYPLQLFWMPVEVKPFITMYFMTERNLILSVFRKR